MLDLQRHGAVIGQVIGIIHERLTQSLIDDQATEAGAVDHHFNIMPPGPFQHQVADIALFIKFDLLNFVLNMLDPSFYADLGQHPGEFHRVEMVGIAKALVEFRLTKGARAFAQAAQIIMRRNHCAE